jgi:hypothetical protein
MWVAVDFGTNKGVSACLPAPIDLAFQNTNLIVNFATVAVLVVGFRKLMKMIFPTGKK